MVCHVTDAGDDWSAIREFVEQGLEDAMRFTDDMFRQQASAASSFRRTLMT